MNKRERKRLATSELWLQLAMTAQRWADEVVGKTSGVLPFVEWQADEPLKRLCATYELTPEDLSALLTIMAGSLEARAERSGYADAVGV